MSLIILVVLGLLLVFILRRFKALLVSNCLLINGESLIGKAYRLIPISILAHKVAATCDFSSTYRKLRSTSSSVYSLCGLLFLIR